MVKYNQKEDFIMKKLIAIVTTFFKILAMVSLSVCLSICFFNRNDFRTKASYASHLERGERYYNLKRVEPVSNETADYHPLLLPLISLNEDLTSPSMASFLTYLPESMPSDWTYLSDTGPKTPNADEAIVTLDFVRIHDATLKSNPTGIIGREYHLSYSRCVRVVNVIDTKQTCVIDEGNGFASTAYLNCSYLTNSMFVTKDCVSEVNKSGTFAYFVAEFHSVKEIRNALNKGYDLVDPIVDEEETAFAHLEETWRISTMICAIGSLMVLFLLDLKRKEYPWKRLVITDASCLLSSILIGIVGVLITTAVWGLHAQVLSHLMIALCALIPFLIVSLLDLCFFFIRKKQQSDYDDCHMVQSK